MESKHAMKTGMLKRLKLSPVWALLILFSLNSFAAGSYDASLLSNKFASWGINPSYKDSNINLLKAWGKFSKKKDVIVAVIDTGIDPKHPHLKANLYTAFGKTGVKNFGVDFSKNNRAKTAPFDNHGHGTHVAGIIKSVFPHVKILTLKYYNPMASGQDNLNSTIKALDYAVNANVDIINYSGGGPEPSLEELRILKKAEKKGILVVAAAGNENSNIDQRSNAYYPASYGLRNIITVTAHNQTTNILSSSNWGPNTVDISAPGYRIKSSIPNNRAHFMTGTSQATAFVSGVAALIKSQHPKLTAVQIKEAIKSSAAKSKTLAGKCSTSGKLNAEKAIKVSTVIANGSKKRGKRGVAQEMKKTKSKQRYFQR